MGLKPGQTNNPKGRPVGRQNKVTTSTREFLNSFLNKNRVKLQKDWDLLKPYERVQMFEKLLSFTLPKMTSLEVDMLPEEQLNEIINEIIKNHEKSKGV